MGKKELTKGKRWKWETNWKIKEMYEERKEWLTAILGERNQLKKNNIEKQKEKIRQEEKRKKTEKP